MTMIAIATHDDRVQIMSDSLAYGPALRSLSHVQKVHMHPRALCASTASGNGPFAEFWRVWVGPALDNRGQDFARTARDASGALQRSYAVLKERGGPNWEMTCTAFLTGYLPAEGRFRTFMFSSEDDFEATDPGPVVITPSPLRYRPSAWELKALERVTQWRGIASDDGALAAWAARPAPPCPRTPQEWATLAMKARVERGLADRRTQINTPVGGTVTLTSLSRGGITQDELFEFDDRVDGPQFAELIRGSMHPLALAETCTWCDSGKPFRDCGHFGPLDQDCWCDSGRELGRCCAPPVGQAPATWPGVQEAVSVA